MRAKIWGIVAAAGIGARMAAQRPKQYLPLAGRRVIDHAVLGVCQNHAVAGVVVGIRDGDRWWRQQPFAHPKLLGTSAGGAHRAATVLNALAWLLDEKIAAADDWALVHDAVRPCVLGADMARLAAAARAHGSGAVLGIKVVDALKRAAHDGVIEQTLTAADAVYWRAVTPQMFRCRALKTALQHAVSRGIMPVDESAAMELLGVKPPLLVAASPTNIKITQPIDLELAEIYMNNPLSADGE